MKALLRARRTEIAFLVCFLLALVVSVRELRVVASMSELLPPSSRAASKLAQYVIDRAPSRAMVLSIGGGELAEARRAAKHIANSLGDDPRVSWVEVGPRPGHEEALFELYFARRFQFVSGNLADLPEATSEGALRERLERLRQRLAGPSGPLVRSLAPRDPLGLHLDSLSRIEHGLSGARTVEVRDGQFVSQDGHALVFVGLRDSALDGSTQAGLLDAIDELMKERAPGLLLERSGVNVFAADIEARIRADVARITGISLLSIALLFLSLYRSLTSLLVASLPLAFGLLVATASSAVLFDGVHALTFAFGASLLGVCIDYPVHLMNQRAASSERDKGGAARTGIALGALTTMAGIAALSLSGFSVMIQVAVFSCTGLFAAAVLTLVILPRLPNAGTIEPRRRLSLGLLTLVRGLGDRRALLWPCLLVALGLSGYGLCTSRWDTSLEALAPRSPELQAEDERVRARIGAPSSSLLALVEAPDDELALTRNDALHRELRRAHDDGLIDSLRSLHDFAWSSAVQRENLEAARDPAFKQRVRKALSDLDFDVGAFDAFYSELDQAAFRPLGLAELRASPLRNVVDRFALSEPGRTLILSYFSPTSEDSLVHLERRLGRLVGVHLVAQRQMLDEAYVALRQRVRWALLAGALCMTIIVAARYRRPSNVMATAFCALAAPVIGLGFVALSGQSLNLFHLFAALAVLSMAMDYGIFATETRHESELVRAATLLSIVIAALTTCLGFGMLGLSTVPALAGIGQTVCAGIIVALLLVPLSFTLHRDTARGARS